MSRGPYNRERGTMQLQGAIRRLLGHRAEEVTALDAEAAHRELQRLVAGHVAELRQLDELRQLPPLDSGQLDVVDVDDGDEDECRWCGAR